MDLDNEVLIALVFDKQCLWDKTHKFHSNRNVTDKCWKEISLEMKQDESKIRKRWRYLRDQFAVELGKISPSRSGDEATTVYPKWPYFKPLLFLKPMVKARLTTGSLTRQRSHSNSAVSLDSETEYTQTTNDHDCSLSPGPSNMEDTDASDQPTVSPAMPVSKIALKRPKRTINDKLLDIENQKLKFLQDKEKSRQNRTTDADNEHILFFKSLIPHIEKIPQHMLLSFRNRIQSVVDEFAYQSLQYGNPSSMSNYSHLSNVSRNSTPETCNEITLPQTSSDNIAVISNQLATEEYIFHCD
ncbi:unnamed protein product [Pieris macdunnoughi]|uniref:MADF domain-containing protein n=2 Tax=Pieris macdunnoughi TaxID=345717 RepID=A0A821ULS2_9NEOP|nr:unnamed protein product [Pieris macdunnoughi]